MSDPNQNLLNVEHRRIDLLGDYHALVIAPSGLIQVLHSEHPIDIQSWLVVNGSLELGRLGEYVRLILWPHDDEPGEVHFLASNVHENGRARAVLASLTDVHIRLTGNVVFTGLSEARTFEIIGAVG